MDKLADLIRFCLLGTGLLYVLTRSQIFRWPRMFIARHGGLLALALVYCPPCSGFWLGLALVPLWPWHTSLYGIDSAFALCSLGAWLSLQWDGTAVGAELDELGANLRAAGVIDAVFEGDDAPDEDDEHGSSPKEG